MRRRQLGWRALSTALLLLLASAVADAAGFQRMLLPTQSFSIAPGGTTQAKAYCLDVFAHTPKQGAAYTGAPANLGDISVSVPGHGTMPGQSAIDKGYMEVVGTGNFSTIGFRSLVGGPIRVEIKHNSVVLPNKNDATEDLAGLPILSAPPGTLSQPDIWDQRQATAKKQLGDLAQTFSSDTYDTAADEVLANKLWLNRHPQQRMFLLQRLENQDEDEDSGEPLYVLYKPDGKIKTYVGNDALSLAAADDIIKASAAQGERAPARIIMVGEGRKSDFDAARLTLETAAGGYGGGNIIGPGVHPSFDFTPPDGPGPPSGGDVYRGGNWKGLLVTKKAGTLHATQPFFDRGNVTVFSKTATLLARMAVTVREIFRLSPALKTASVDQVVETLRASLAAEVADAKANIPTLAQREGDTPSALLTIDNAAHRIKFANTQLPDENQHRALVANATGR